MTGSLATVLTPCPPLPSGEGERRANCISPLPKGEGIKGVRNRARGTRASGGSVLLIHHPHAGRGGKRELATGHAGVHPDVSQDHAALLAGALDGGDTMHQPVVLTQPARRIGGW